MQRTTAHLRAASTLTVPRTQAREHRRTRVIENAPLRLQELLLVFSHLGAVFALGLGHVVVEFGGVRASEVAHLAIKLVLRVAQLSLRFFFVSSQRTLAVLSPQSAKTSIEARYQFSLSILDQ